MDLTKLKTALENEPKYRLTQAYKFIYSNFISDWDAALSLPKVLREKLKVECPLDINAEIFTSDTDDTQKALITLDDGSKIEAVLMQHADNHNTICVTCQVGCGMNCAFCATGKMGLKRNLTTDEIIMQALLFARILHKNHQRLTNVVFMGMGEPLSNYDNVMGAVKMLNDPGNFNIAARKISISTCGLVPGIEKLGDEPLQLNLAVSLHAPNNEIRKSLMPVNKQFDIDKTLSAVSDFINKTNRKVMIEYILLRGINDSRAHAKELAKILRKYLGHLFMVNLIVYNSTGGKFQAPAKSEVINFKKSLESAGIVVTQRYRLGHDIKGACGQLAGEE